LSDLFTLYRLPQMIGVGSDEAVDLRWV